jgi:hypothetical protein
VALTTAGPVTTADAVGRDFWNRRGTEALEEGESGGRWVLIYFPDPDAKRDPTEIRSFSVPPKMTAELIGARARAEELEALWKLFRMDADSDVPALVLVSPHGEPVHGWKKRWRPHDVLEKFLSERRDLLRRYKSIDRLLERAERAFKLARAAESIKLAKEAATNMRKGFPQEARIQNLAGRLRTRADDALLQTLALEGLVADSKLLRDLARLAGVYPLDKFVERIESEKERVRARTVGGE